MLTFVTVYVITLDGDWMLSHLCALAYSNPGALPIAAQRTSAESNDCLWCMVVFGTSYLRSVQHTTSHYLCVTPTRKAVGAARCCWYACVVGRAVNAPLACWWLSRTLCEVVARFAAGVGGKLSAGRVVSAARAV